MGAITGTLAGNTEFAGNTKLITVTAPLAAASDTITLTAASHGGAKSILGIVGYSLRGGLDANLANASISYSGLVITVVTVNAAGGAATNWTSATIEISVLIQTQ
jgi:hypothetical protein